MIEAYIQDHQLNAMRIAGAREVPVDRMTAPSPCTTLTPAKILGTCPRPRWTRCARPLPSPRLPAPAHPLRARRHPEPGGRIISQRLDQVANSSRRVRPVHQGRAVRSRPRQRRAACSAPAKCCKDDGQIFSCDLTPHGKKRRVYTQRDPLLGVITAITPFNHPMNQVAHKVVPSIATNNRMVLKPSEKVPLSAILFADILYEAGLPPEMLSVITGDPREIADELITNPSIVDLVTFTGGVAIGKYIASKGRLPAHGARTRRQRPDHRDGRRRLDEASTLAVQGSYKNSGQRCTAVKRMLVHEAVADRFVTEQVVEKTRAWKYGDPADPGNDMGTVIDEAAAMLFERASTRPWRRVRGCWWATGVVARCIRPPCSTR
jgi:hypothetical protein